MVLLNGKKVAREIEEDLRKRVSRFKASAGMTPKLATILVGADPASKTYVRMKANACRRVGMDSLQIELEENATTGDLLAAIADLNENPTVHGILLQHPVPPRIKERECFEAIDLRKDVDGVTSSGFGRLAMGLPAFGAATAMGIMRLLRAYEIPLEGRHAVLAGRSPILGKPLAAMLLNANATVTLCHSRTKHLDRHIGRGEIVVGAVGKPHFIRAAWIRDGSVLIDAGYHPGGIGDIEPPRNPERLSAYTPVPGGVGPMTIALLISQTLDAAEQLARKGIKV